MWAKKVLASIFAVVILLKLPIGLTSPGTWMRGVEWLLEHDILLMGIYLTLIVITGYYALSSIDIIDIAVVMFLTSLLVAISLIPYTAALLKLREEMLTVGVGKAWPAVVLWAAIGVAVLYRVISGKRGLPGKG